MAKKDKPQNKPVQKQEVAPATVVADTAKKASCDAFVTKVKVHHNPAFLEWPTDVWGLTKDLKKAITALASRVKGQPDKMELVEKTLEVALGHLNARYEHDSVLREARLKKYLEDEAEVVDPNEVQQF